MPSSSVITCIIVSPSNDPTKPSLISRQESQDTSSSITWPWAYWTVKRLSISGQANCQRMLPFPLPFYYIVVRSGLSAYCALSHNIKVMLLTALTYWFQSDGSAGTVGHSTSHRCSRALGSIYFICACIFCIWLHCRGVWLDSESPRW